MHAHDHANPEQFHDLTEPRPDLVFPDKRHPEKRPERGQNRPPGNQDGCTDGNKTPQDRGGSDQQDEQMKLEERADAGIMRLRKMISIQRSTKVEKCVSCRWTKTTLYRIAERLAVGCGVSVLGGVGEKRECFAACNCVQPDFL